MIPKIVWPQAFEKGNPFGGVDGFRPIRITFHSGSFGNVAIDEKKALDILMGLARFDGVDAMSFDGSVWPKISIDPEREEKQRRGLKIIDSDGKIIMYSGVYTSWLDPHFMAYLLGIYSSNDEEKYRPLRQELLEAKSHEALDRDVFITSSDFLLKYRDKLSELNIRSPREALKIIGLYLRMKGEFEWISHIQNQVLYQTSSDIFYEFLARGLLPNSWRYVSGLGLHRQREKLFSLGWSVLERYARALQARDEMARLFYMPSNYSSKSHMAYHFDYLTLLLPAALDAQALIINEIYGLGLSDSDCGLNRRKFKNAVSKNSVTSNLNTLLTTNESFIKILFDLRNKIHSVSLKTDFHVPATYPDELLERIYLYNPSNHWGIQKQKVDVITNRSAPVPSIDYSIDVYNLAYCLLGETTELINIIMEETKIEHYLDVGEIPKILKDPPADMLPSIETYLLLA